MVAKLSTDLNLYPIHELLRHDLNSWTVSTLFPVWHSIIFPSLCNADPHIISLGKTKHNHHSNSHPIVSCTAPQQNALYQSVAPGSQILGSLVWASYRNTLSSFQTKKRAWADQCSPTNLSPHIDGFSLNRTLAVVERTCCPGDSAHMAVKNNLSAVVAVSLKTSVLSTSLSSLAAVCYIISALGVTAGAHRLWSHRSYKASFPLRVFLALCNSMAFQVMQNKCIFPFSGLKVTSLWKICFNFCSLVFELRCAKLTQKGCFHKHLVLQVGVYVRWSPSQSVPLSITARHVRSWLWHQSPVLWSKFSISMVSSCFWLHWLLTQVLKVWGLREFIVQDMQTDNIDNMFAIHKTQRNKKMHYK